MLLLALVLLPLLGALGAYLHRAEVHRTAWLVSVAALHLVLLTVLLAFAGIWATERMVRRRQGRR